MESIDVLKSKRLDLKKQLKDLEDSRDEIIDKLEVAKSVQAQFKAQLKEYQNPKPQKRSFMQMLFEKMIEKMEKGL